MQDQTDGRDASARREITVQAELSIAYGPFEEVASVSRVCLAQAGLVSATVASSDARDIESQY